MWEGGVGKGGRGGVVDARLRRANPGPIITNHPPIPLPRDEPDREVNVSRRMRKDQHDPEAMPAGCVEKRVEHGEVVAPLPDRLDVTPAEIGSNRVHPDATHQSEITVPTVTVTRKMVRHAKRIKRLIVHVHDRPVVERLNRDQ